MHDAENHDAVPPLATARGQTELEAFLHETREMPASRLFALCARQIAALGTEVVVGPLGVQFRHRDTPLCELSHYGEIFIARVGPGLAVEYRVRSEEVALLALDQALRTFVQLGPPGLAEGG